MSKNMTQNIPYNPALKHRAAELRKAGNLSEVLLWLQIKNKKFKNLDFDRQTVIGNYIVDFYCADKKLVIEIDGASHNEKADYDIERDNFFKELGLNIVHLLDIVIDIDIDIKKNIEDVMKYLDKII